MQFMLFYLLNVKVKIGVLAAKHYSLMDMFKCLSEEVKRQ